MKLNEINKVIKKVSEELTNINKKYNTDINIFFEVKSRLLCKMLYNVFTISTYQN
ncbi:Uncharacterised protein [Staphylococcus aureus]|nr:Uncharacterised protein [Staphylococcus aureus]CAC8197646.1 Uncharacterised protein [Staphylococcus aureus]CAC8206020.1 Uncharacterised protein [Staphylococcus aureus]